MRRIAVLLTILSTAIASGCASVGTTDTEVERTEGRTSDGALLKLHSDREGPVWKDWAPTPDARVVPENLAAVARAFDYWRVVDRATIEAIWEAVFPVVDSVRAGTADGDRRKTLDLMLEAIEPGADGPRTGMDLTFLVSENGGVAFEGLACRLYRRLDSGATPVLTVLMLRQSERSSSPSRIVVWAAPGFREPVGMTASFRRKDGGADTWRRRVIDGLEFPNGASSGDSGDEAGNLAAKLLTERIWERFAGRAYLQSELSNEVASADRIAGPEAALGLEVTRREIEQVYSDTEFPPRAEFDDLQ